MTPEPRDPGDPFWRSWFGSTAPLPAVPRRRLAWALGAFVAVTAAAGLYAWAWFAPASGVAARPEAVVVSVPASAVTVTSRPPAGVVTVPGMPVPGPAVTVSGPGMTVRGASVTRFVTAPSRPQQPETVARAPVRAANVPVSVVTRTAPATPRPTETVTTTAPGPTKTVTETATTTAPGPTKTVTITVTPTPEPSATTAASPAPSGQAAG